MKEIQKLDEDWMKQAEDLGLLDQKLFAQAVDAYNFQIELAEKLRENIREIGTTIIVPVGRDGEKIASNPAIADLNKAEILAQKIRLELDKKMDRALIQQEKDKENDLRL